MGGEKKDRTPPLEGKQQTDTGVRTRRYTVEFLDGDIVDIVEVGDGSTSATTEENESRLPIPPIPIPPPVPIKEVPPGAESITARHIAVSGSSPGKSSAVEKDAAEEDACYERKEPVMWHKIDYREAMILVALETPATRSDTIARCGLHVEDADALFDALEHRGLIHERGRK